MYRRLSLILFYLCQESVSTEDSPEIQRRNCVEGKQLINI